MSQTVRTIHSLDMANLAPQVRASRGALMFVMVILLVGGMVLGRDLTAGGFRFGDASAHAMDGILIHDWIMAGPSVWLQPMPFAVEQYGHYPTLGIGRFYPPGFAIIESIFFALFGVTIVTARLCVLFFGLLAGVGAYVLVRRRFSERVSLFTAVILLSLPSVVTWGRQTMLEIPTLAALIWTSILFDRFLAFPTWTRWTVAFTCGIACLLFKQPAVFLLGAMSLTVGFAWIQGRCSARFAVASAVVCLSVISGLYFSLDFLGRLVVSGLRIQPGMTGLGGWLFYATQLPREAGHWVVLAALIGLPFCWRRSSTFTFFLLAWLAVCYVMLSGTDLKNERFLCVGLFPLAVFAAHFVAWLTSKIPAARLQTACALWVVAALAGIGVARNVEHRPDYGPVVAAHRDQIAGNVVLFSGLRDGDFVFAVRQEVPWRSSVVLRGSKLFYTCAAVPEIDFEPRVNGPEEIAGILQRYGCRYIFVERDNKTGLLQDQWLRDYLREGRDYHLMASHSLNQQPDDSAPSYLDVYESTSITGPTESFVDVYIPRGRRTVRVDLRPFQRSQPRPTAPTPKDNWGT